MNDSALAEAIGLALTGRPDLVLAVEPDPLAALTEQGWGRDRIIAHAQQTLAAGGVWPHPVPDELRVRVGSARLFAALQRLQVELGLFGRTAAPAPPRRPTADERRLLDEVPPHHGS
ncbi:MAG: hypothetical protein QM619_14230 [Micropruina sp.]|uniref:hypothetical protein n=1 Tax=Micropruina sp. TaxID=2737536 RepID=UPI0039E3FA93